MQSKQFKSIVIYALLAGMVCAGYVHRLRNFHRLDYKTTDEIAYAHLGAKLSRDVTNYQSHEFGLYLEDLGRYVPDYFHKPLFKHPPLFSMFVALSYRLSDMRLERALYPSLIFGLLLIPLAFLLAGELFDEHVGLLAAVLVYLDPVAVLCSQKIWMETTLAFFTVLAAYLFILGVRRNRPWLYVAGGLAAGLATMVKYPGFLAAVIMGLYALVLRRALFRSGKFLAGLAMPLIVSLPWIIWNYRVYGWEFLALQKRLHSNSLFLKDLPLTLLAALVLVVAAVAFHRFMRLIRKRFEGTWPLIVRGLLAYLGLILVVFLHREIALGLRADHVPGTTWSATVWQDMPKTFLFYPGRLTEFSLFYLFAFASYFILRRDKSGERVFVFLCSLVILGFYTAWGNYQLRYVLAAVPFLMIQAAEMMVWAFRRADAGDDMLMRLSGKAAVLLLFFYALAKVIFVNITVSYPNNMCYF